MTTSQLVSSDEASRDVEARTNRGGLLCGVGMGVGAIVVTGAGGIGYRPTTRGCSKRDAAAQTHRGTDGAAETGCCRSSARPSWRRARTNAQAWRFALAADRIDTYADGVRNTGAIDPFRREMYVGLGAALENLLLAADANGFTTSVALMPTEADPTHAVRVALTRSAQRPSPLNAQVPRRHTNRDAYKDAEVPQSAFAAMTALAGADTPSARLFWFTSSTDRGQIGELFVAATEAIIDDSDQSASDFKWFRQSWDQIQRHRDGITVDAAGLPQLTASLATLLPAQSQRATGEAWLASTRERHTTTAAGYGIVAVRDAMDNRQRLEGGRLLERTHLWATGHALGLHRMNQLTERADREVQLGLTPRVGDALRDLLPSEWQALRTYLIGEAAAGSARTTDAV